MIAKQLIKSGTALAAALLLNYNLTVAAADAWETVDLFQLELGFGASAGDIAVAPGGGPVIAVGSGKSSANPDYPTAAINLSADAGTTWALAATYAEPGWPHSHFHGVAADSLGRIFAGCTLYNPVGPEKAWVLRESIDGGQTWETSDFFRLAQHSGNSCADVKVAPNGDVYAAGYAADSVSWSWVVRKRALGQSSFSTVDAFSIGGLPHANAIAFHPIAGVFVVGNGSKWSTQSLWTVRKSTGGAPGTWKTVDTFAEDGFSSSEAVGIAVSSTGILYVVGVAEKPIKVKNKSTKVNNWLVRRSINGGTTWTTVDTFGAAAQELTISAHAVGVDSAGVVFVAGITPTGWLVRKGITAANGTMSWTNSDEYQMVPGASSRANGLAIGANDEVYATGWAHDENGLGYWATRKLIR